MIRSFASRTWALAILALAATGCVTPQPYDFTAFKQSRPTSILVLPPVNTSPDILATNSVLSQVTYPLAEAGYYVFPVTLVNETFKQNGLNNAAEMHDVDPRKLHEIFGADSALYINVTQYGTTYAIIASESRVTANAKLVDLRTGTVIWGGSATASSAEGRNSGGGLAGMLITALVSQIIESATNQAHPVAGVMSNRLLAAGGPNGIPYGPRSPQYLADGNLRP